MDNRLYFVAGDFFSNILVGLSAALANAAMISSHWPMPAAMIISMVLGMIIAILLNFVLLLRYFGAMEVMLPTMLSGMLAGMAAGMTASMTDLSLGSAALLGCFIGACVCVYCWAANNQLIGKVTD